jgi:limonene-1,2-epoxide hydrolase
MTGRSLVDGVGDSDLGLTEAQHGRASAWVRVFADAWVRGEWSRLLEVVHPDASIFYPGMERPTDREGLREFFEQGFATMPDFRIRIRRWAAVADEVLIEWSATGTVGEERIAWGGMDRFTFRDELIVEARAYYDTRPILEAIARGLAGQGDAGAVNAHANAA